VTLGVPLGIAEVWGANFNGTSTVFIDGQASGYTTLVNSGVLQVTLADSVSATVGTHQFTVVQNTGTSNASTFTVYTPQTVPTVMNAFPAYLLGNEVSPPCVVVADVNGDGFADVLVTDWDDGQISIMDGNADGSLSPPQVLSITQAYALAVADVSGDGNVDLISVSSDQLTTSTVSVLLGDGHGTFQPASSQQTVSGYNPAVVGVTDIDGDGQPDLVLYVEYGLGFNVVWLKNTGNGNFAPPVTLAQVAGDSVALADFNQDGKPDLLYGLVNTSTGTSVFHLLVNQGGGKFADQVAAGLSGYSGIPTAIDFNVDGIPDLVVEQAEGFPATFTLYSFRGNADGSFTQVAKVPVPYSLQFVTGDFDHDGFPDLAGDGIVFLFGDGTGNFLPLLSPGPEGERIAVGDINGDGIPDVVVPDESDFVAVALGRTNRNFPAPLVLVSESWGNVKVGDVLGNGFPEIFTGGIDDPVDGFSLPGTVFLNQGNGSFAFGANVSIDSFAIEDLTGKGVVDMIGSNGNSLYIWPNNGTLGFSPSPLTLPTLFAIVLIQFSDMDNDGHPDIFTNDEILYGNGDYQFTAVPMPAIGNQYFVAGDFAGNGRQDILVGNSVLMNMGNRNFQAVPTNVPQGYEIAVGDFNGDGKDDLVLSDGSDVLSIWYSNGDGTFYQSTQLALGGGVQAGSFVVGDFNGDGRLDLAVSTYSDEVAMFFNQPGGQFTLSYFVAGTSAYSMRAGDLNNSGNLGLALEPPPPEYPPTTVNVVFHQ